MKPDDARVMHAINFTLSISTSDSRLHRMIEQHNFFCAFPISFRCESRNEFSRFFKALPPRKCDQNKTNANMKRQSKLEQRDRKKNIARLKHTRALMTNNEVEAKSLPLSPLKYFERSRSSLIFTLTLVAPTSLVRSLEFEFETHLKMKRS